MNQIRKNRKYSLKEMEQKNMLEWNLGKIRTSNPNVFKPSVTAILQG